jgi:hypothetical protein
MSDKAAIIREAGFLARGQIIRQLLNGEKLIKGIP